MLLRLQKYDLIATYKKGSEMYLADTLSRALLQTPSNQNLQGEAEKDTESIKVIQYLLDSESMQTTICKAMESDMAMTDLKTTIREG